eukprot:scaffold203259_cov47-Prasinocladus_malaysianus.AAC.1
MLHEWIIKTVGHRARTEPSIHAAITYGCDDGHHRLAWSLRGQISSGVAREAFHPRNTLLLQHHLREREQVLMLMQPCHRKTLKRPAGASMVFLALYRVGRSSLSI